MEKEQRFVSWWFFLFFLVKYVISPSTFSEKLKLVHFGNLKPI